MIYNNYNNYVQPRGSFGNCATCGRGAEFPRVSARLAWLFLIGVYSAHRVYLTEFSSLRPNVRDFPAGWVAASFAFAEPAGPPLPHRFMVSLPHLPHCTGTNSRFRWTLQYFCILQGQVLSSSPSDKLSSVSSYFGFASWQLRAGKQLSSVSSYIGFAYWQLLASPHSRKVAREIFLAFHQGLTVTQK